MLSLIPSHRSRPDRSQSSRPRGRREWPTWVSIWILVLIVAIPTGLAVGKGPYLPATATPGRTVSAAANAVAAAASSLSAGAGPALGAPLTCAVATAQATCGPAVVPFVNGSGWENLTNWSTPTPACRSSLGMTYDAYDRYVVLFDGLAGCGQEGASHSDTWTYQAGHWTNITSNLSSMPSARTQFQLVYDPIDATVILFGGAAGADATILNDTWSYAAGNWTELFPTSAPSARFQYSATWDAADGEVLLFGGVPNAGGNNSNSYYNDTWTFVHGGWTQVLPSIAPSPRRAAGLAYDAWDGRVILFGGVNWLAKAQSDTWTYLAGTWTLVRPASGVAPSARWDPGMTFDRSLGAVLLFGGCTALGCYGADADTWAYLNGTWTNLTGSLSLSPSARGSVELTYDAHDEYAVFFGGAAPSGRQADTWAFLGGNYSIGGRGTSGGNGSGTGDNSGRGLPVTPNATGWTNLTSGLSVSPLCRSSMGMTYDARDGYVLLVDGLSGCTPYGSSVHSDTWEFGHGNWTNVTASLGAMPSGRSSFQLVYDPRDGYVVLFGGEALDGAGLSDTWTWSNGSWSQLSPTLTPAGRIQYSATYDAADGVVLMFGGAPFSGAGSYLNDTWTFTSGQWTSVNVTGGTSPSARRLAGLAYDPTAGMAVLFGGVDAFATALSDTWTYHAGTWTSVGNLSASPSPRWDVGMSWDSRLGAILLFGGCTSLGCVSNVGETWAWSNGTWSNLTPALSVSPSPRGAISIADDAADEYAVFFGGAQLGGRLADTWVFTTANRSGSGSGNGSGNGNGSGGDGGIAPGYGYGGRGLPVTPNAMGWTNLTPGLGVIPLCRSSMGMTYDARDGYVLLVDGLSGCTAYGSSVHSDTWEFSHGNWTNVTANLTAAPSARSSFQLVYDARDGFVVLFGGEALDGAGLSDTWTWSNGGWSQLFPATTPPGRIQYSATYDTADGVVLMFGGAPFSGAPSYLNDTWTFTAGQWTLVNVSAGVGPSARRLAALAYDAAAGDALLFGGVDPYAGALSDTWTYHAGTWTVLSNLTAHPSARWDPGMSWDDRLDAVLLFGGCTSLGCLSNLGDTWAWSNGTWIDLTPSLTPSPSPRGSVSIAYDAADEYAVFLGGAQLGGRLNDTWVFTTANLSGISGGSTGGPQGGSGGGNGNGSGSGSGNGSGLPRAGSPAPGGPTGPSLTPSSFYGMLPDWGWAGGRLGFLLGLVVGVSVALSLAFLAVGGRRRSRRSR